MRFRYITAFILTILFMPILSDITVLAGQTETLSDEMTVAEVEELSVYDSMPVGGWSPVEEYRIEEDIDVKQPEIFHSRNVYNATVDSVFSKSAGTVGYDALSQQKQKYYSLIDKEAVKFMEAVEDLKSTRLNTSSGSRDVYVVAQINYSNLGLKQEEAIQVFCAYDYDHPAYYWISNNIFWSNNSIYLCTEKEYASVEHRKTINNYIIDGVNRYAELAGKAKDTLDKIAVIHDQIITDVDYAYENDGTTPVSEKWAHSVQGVFDPQYHKSVCEGYADTFSLMMNYLDIPNYYIVGTAGTGAGRGGHAWNAVSDDEGATYMYMDLTWDDCTKDKGFFYKYFGMPSDDFLSSHFAYTPENQKSEWLYEVKGTFNNELSGTYYSKGGFYCSSGDCEEFAKTIRTKAYRFGTVFSYLSDNENIRKEIAKNLNLSNYVFYNVTYLNKNYYIVIVKDVSEVDLSDAEIELADDVYEYTGEEVTPEVVSVSLNGIELIKDNYTIAYSENVETGNQKAYVKISGTGCFKGNCQKAFSISDAFLKTENVILSDLEFMYDGSEKKPEITVKHKEKVLIEDTDYKVQYSDNITDVGTVAVTVTGVGEYYGTVEKTYIISPGSIRDFVVGIEEGTWIYDGTFKEPKVLSLNNGDNVIDKKYYTVTYGNNRNAGNEAEIIVTGQGNYCDRCNVTFTINPKKIAVTGITAEDKIYDGTLDATLVYKDVSLTDCGVIEGDDVNVTATGKFSDADAGNGKTVVISDITLAGKASDNYELPMSEQQKATVADIIPKTVTITAMDQAVVHNGNIDQRVEKALLRGALSNHRLTDIKFISSGTEEVTDSGSISLCDAVIQDGIRDVTANYEIEYVNGILKVVHNSIFVDEEPAMCNIDGVKSHYKCSVCNKLFEDEEGLREIIDENTLVIKRGHKPAETVKENEEPATCKTSGYYDEVVYCSVCGEELSRKTVTADAVGHDYEITYTLYEDGEKCIAKAVCKRKDCTDDVNGHEVTETVDTTRVIKIPATTEHKGTTTYSAEFENEIFEIFIKDIDDIPLLERDAPVNPGEEREDESLVDEDNPNVREAEISKATSEEEPATGEEEKLSTVGEDKSKSGNGDRQSAVDEEKLSKGETDNYQSVVSEVPYVKGAVFTDENIKATFVVTSSAGEEPAVKYKLAEDVNDKVVTIPESVIIGGVSYKVTEIADKAFANNKTIEKVVISSNIQSIGDNAFKGCKKLKTIKVPDSVEEIGDSAFANCPALTKVIIPAKVKKLGNNIFKNDKKLKTIIIKSMKLTNKSVNKNAFKGIGSKVTINVPKKMKKTYTQLLRRKGLSKKVTILINMS